MTPATVHPTSLNNTALSQLRTWFGKLWAFNKFATLSVMLYLVLIPIYTVAAIVDPRLITNAPAFVKPLKFILSSGIYVATFLYLLTLVQGKRRWVQIFANVTAAGLMIENIIITAQAVRGIPSHFNNTTALDIQLFNIMGGTITILALLNLTLGIWLLFQRLPNRVTAWGIRLGVLISFVGMMVAFLMTSGPTPTQQAALEAGQRPSAIGAHSVGVDDGGPGLPFVGWSTEGGDLRAPHFVGLHAMQVLPLLALLLNRRRALMPRQRLTLTITAGIAYLGWLILLTWQALRGQSVIALDMPTLTAYVGLLVIVLFGTMLALAMQPRPNQTTTSTPARAQ